MTAPARRKNRARGGKSRYALSPEERAERIEAARAQLAAGVEGLATSDGWRQFVASRRWLSYSVNNQIMILMQRPDATDVRKLSEWNHLKCFVRKDEAAIRIWAPAGRRTAKATGEAAGTEQENSGEGQQQGGGQVASTAPRRRSGFILVSVFDRSQLVEPPAPVEPALPAELRGDAPAGLWDGLTKQVAAAGYVLERGDCGTAYGRANPAAHTVRVRDGVDPAQAAKTLCHELAHVLLGHTAATPGHIREVEAEGTA